MNKITFTPAFPELKNVVPLPEPATKNVPNWYKEQPAKIDNEIQNGVMKLTVKKCQSFFDAMAIGYTLKMPVDIYVDTTDGKQEFQIPKDLDAHKAKIISFHSKEQVSHLPIDTDIYIDHIFRVHPNWMASTPKGYSCFFISPIHSAISPLKAVEAIIDTDNFWSDGHLSFFVKKNFKGILKQGTPLIQVFPFKRDDWEMSINKEVNSEEISEQRIMLRSTFENGYKMKYWVKKLFK